MALGLPSITIAFKSTSITAIERSQRGIIAMILKEIEVKPAEGVKGNADLLKGSPYIVYTTTDIPEGLSDKNKEQIELALMGYQTSPRHILVYIIKADAKDYSDVLISLEHARFDYLVIPEIKEAETQTISTWIKGMRTVKDKMVKAVLPNSAADFEGVVNFTNSKIVTKAKEFTTAEYCSRIAGIICGTPMTISCTFAPLPEVIDCDKYSKDQMDDKVNKGELFVMFDGEKYKIARGVNSYVTTVQGKNDSFKKIKLIDCMDMIHDDIQKTANDNYLGKYANSYDNKCLLISAIQGYFMQLEIDGLLDRGKNDCFIDLDRQAAYLLSNGDFSKDELATMKTQVLKEANTRDKVFLGAKIKILDAIEEITLNVNI